MLVACTGSGSGKPQGVNEGIQAHDFTLKTLAGDRVSLSDYKGNVILINFWATWCPSCKAEIPDLEAAYRAHKGEGFVVLGVDLQEPRQAVERFVADMGMTYPVLLDENGSLMKEYRALGLPTSLIVDRDGVIRVRHAGSLSADQLDKYLADLLP